jgi:hypothetical protein
VEVLEDRSLLSTVFNLSDHDPGSLRDAIATTPDGGTVDFQPGLQGTIFLTTAELLVAKNLTVNGPGQDVITVSGNGAQRQRVFEVAASFTVAISGLTIADGMSSDGAGIRNSGMLTITASTITRNISRGIAILFNGGGIFNSGTLMVISSTIVNNQGLGAGIYNSGTLGITSSTIASNDAVTMLRSAGGGIENTGTLSISASTISANNISNEGDSARGGGIDNNGTLTVTNSTISGNHGFGTGGGIYNNGTLTVTNSTISGNFVGGLGRVGGLFGGGTLRNTILAGNRAPMLPDVSGSLDSQGHNLFGDGTGGSGFADTDLVGTSAFPLDPQLQPLGDYGGPTPTMRPLPSSPVLNAGDNTDAPATDQRGFPRIVLGFIDIGAVELQPSEFGGPGGSGGSGGGAAVTGLVQPLPWASLPVLLTVPTDTTPRTANAETSSTRPASERDRRDAVFQSWSDRRHQPREHRRSLSAVDSEEIS